MKTYQWTTNSNAAPFCSDTGSGFIDAPTAMQALKKVVGNYSHPAGLFAAMICEVSEKNPVLARYLSGRANTGDKAGSGTHQWKGEDFYFNDRKMPTLPESWENLE